MFERILKKTRPLMTGGDVAQLQLRLLELGYVVIGEPDGVFGGNSERAVKDYQSRNGLVADGIVGRQTWNAVFDISSTESVSEDQSAPWLKALPDLIFPHRYEDSIEWFLAREGVLIAGNSPEKFMNGRPLVEKIWRQHDDAIEGAAEEFHVPVELIVATIMTESNGNARGLRTEPGYRSDRITPNKVSAGLMQTLISTAAHALGQTGIDRQWLYVPKNSIRAGTAYIAQQWPKTRYDPPKVACAYNAGGIYHNASRQNRWRMRQYPINSSEHADRFVKWFNDSMGMFSSGSAPRLSFSNQ